MSKFNLTTRPGEVAPQSVEDVAQVQPILESPVQQLQQEVPVMPIEPVPYSGDEELYKLLQQQVAMEEEQEALRPTGPDPRMAIARELASDPGFSDQPNLQAQGSASMASAPMMSMELGTDPFTGEPQQDIRSLVMKDAEGNELSLEEKLKRSAIQQERIARALERPGAIDYTKQAELNTLKEGIIKDTEKGVIQEAALNINRILNESTINPNVNGIDPTNTTQKGMELMQGIMQTDERNVTGAFTNAMIVAGNELQKLAEQTTDPNADVTDAFSFEDLDMSMAESKNKVLQGTQPEIFGQRGAAAAKKFLVNQDIGMGGDGSRYKGIQAAQIKDMFLASALNSGYFKEDVDSLGKPIIVPTTLGFELIRKGKMLGEETVGDKKVKQGKRTTMPASKSGFYADTRMKKIRKQYKNKYSKAAGNKLGDSKEIQSYMEAMSNSFYSTTTEQLSGLALLSAMAANGDQRAAKIVQLDDKRKAKMIGNKGERGLSLANAEFRKTAGKLNESLATLGDILKSGVGETTMYSMDPAVLRIYPENNAVEVQGNLFNRKLVNNMVSRPIKIDQKVGDRLFSKDIAERAESYFLKNYSTGIKDRDMIVLSNLALIQKNIETARNKSFEGLGFKDRMNLLTLNAIKQYANTGMHLKSAMIKMGLEGSSGNDILQKYAFQFDENNNPTQMALPQFTPEETDAINQWISLSDKKTAGFILTSFLDAFAFEQARNSNGYYKPRVMGEQDMNSAGRAFIASDTGNKEVLKRVGILWGDYYDPSNPTTLSFGGPRQYFAATAHEILTNDNDYYANNIFTNLEGTPNEKKEVSAKLDAIFRNIDSQEASFADDFAKKVLLVDDYGMPVMMHQGNAKAFLDGHKQYFDQFINDNYDGDEYKFINDLSNLYTMVLLKDGSKWQKDLPKNMTQYLQFFGRFPQPILMFGENASIGSQTLREMEGQETLVNVGGREVIIPKFDHNPVLNPLQQSKPKKVTAYKDMTLDDGTKVKRGEEFLYEARLGSSAINQIGPLLGQYRESATLIKSINKMHSDPTDFIASVHDNLITDGNTYLKSHFALNDARNGGAAEVLDFDMMAQFIDDFDTQFDEIKAELNAMYKRREPANLGRNGKYAFLGAKAQEVKRTLENMQKGDPRKEWYTQLDAIFSTISPNTPVDGDFKTLNVPAENFLKPITVTKGKGTSKEETRRLPAILALPFLWGLEDGKKNMTSGEAAFQREEARKARKRERLINFVS